jgi:hypothetical protein
LSDGLFSANSKVYFEIRRILVQRSCTSVRKEFEPQTSLFAQMARIRQLADQRYFSDGPDWRLKSLFKILAKMSKINLVLA